MTQTILDLDALMDANLDAVADIPDYVTPPPGTYMVKCNEVELQAYKTKEQKDAHRIACTYEIVSTEELAEGSQPIADKSLFTERFNYDETGLGYFKRAAKAFLNVEDLSGASLRDIFASMKEEAPRKVAITNTSSVVDKADGTKATYTNMRMRVLPIA